MIPQLDQQAYGRNQDSFSNDISALGVLQGIKQEDTQNAFNEREYADQQANTQAAKAQNLLAMGLSNAEIAKSLGITEQQAAQYANMVTSGMMADISKVNRTNTGGSGSSGSGSKAKPSGTGGSSIESMYKAMLSSGYPEAYLAQNYKKFGIPAGQISTIVDGYKKWAKAQPGKTPTAAAGSTGTSVTVTGYGRLSFDEVEAMVDRGELLETKRGDGGYSYSKNPNYKK